MRHLLGGGCPPETGPKALDGDGEAILKLPEALSMPEGKDAAPPWITAMMGSLAATDLPGALPGTPAFPGASLPVLPIPPALPYY